MSDVSNLLARSRAAHADYQRANRAQNPVIEKTAIVSARHFRANAHGLDPNHDDAAWFDDPRPHAELMNFYDSWLAAHADTAVR